MGNAASCTPYVASGRCIKVIDCEGEVQEYVRSIRVAELMLDNPGRFICDSNHLKVGSRVPGLAADEELERQHIYFLLPVDMLYSVLTEEEMIFLSCKASGATKRGRPKNLGRIFPVLSDFCIFPAEANQVEEEVRHGNPKLAVKESRQRSWKPALDTIKEVPCM